MKNLTWQNPEQLFVAQELINKVKSKCCGIKGKEAPPEEKLTRKLMRLVTSKYNIKKGQDFRTAGRSEETLAACVNVHYWKQDAKLWKYCAGPNTKGNFHSINHKVYVREILSDITPDEAFVNELIYSLGDGWNKINEFSVHPSIF